MMNEIDLGEGIKFTIKKGTEVFEIREPFAEEIEEFQKQSKGNESLEPIFDLFDKLGLPKEKSRTFSASQIKKLLNGVIEGLEKK